MSVKSLRPYQEQAICSVIDNLNAGKSRMLITKATGLGKTFTCVKLIERLGFKRVLWITHSAELISQSALAFLKDRFDDEFASHVEAIGFINWVNGAKCHFENKNGKFRMGVIKEDTFKIDADVTIASAQTLWRRLDRVEKDYFDCIITDEAHLFLSKTFVEPLNYFTPKLLLGVTATPTRLDGLSLANVFDDLIFEYNIADGIRDKYLCELDGIRIKTDLSIDSVKTTAGELNTKELSTEVNIPKRNRLIVEKYIQHASGKQGIFFCVDVQHAVDLAEMFNEYGISCKPIVGDEEITPERTKTIKEFKARKITILTNVNILSTGFDEPNVGVIGCCRPTKSLVYFMQGIGRGTRLKDKEYVDKYGQVCTILDFIDSTSRHKLINTWTLDQGKDLENRLFVTDAKRALILEERAKRAAHVENLTKKDERIVLIPLPEPVVIKSIKWKEPATDAQLKWISSLGYDIINSVYTKEMCNQIIQSQPASKEQLEKLKAKGYNTIGATIGNYAAVLNLEAQKKYKQYNKTK